MDRKLSEFVGVLRNHGLRVSPPEIADAALAIALVGYGDRQRFHDALAGTLAKSHQDSLVFDNCFERFFRLETVNASDAPNSSAAALPEGMEFLFGQGQGGGGGSGLGGEPVPGVPPSSLGEQLLDENDNAVALAIARAAIESNLNSIRVLTQKGLFGRRLLMAMGLEDLERELAALKESPLPAAMLRTALLREHLERLRRRVRDIVERTYRLLRQQDRDAILRETDFSLLQESADVIAVVRRLARKLITRHRRRERQAARGLLDVRATLRRNVAHDGILIDPRWRRIRKDRPRVLAVCDVSRSVSRHARFLLLFLYSLQEVIPHLRTFVFASSLHEVTELFERHSVTTALDTVMERHGLGSTDYGRALADLEEQALTGIDRRSTLIFLGDARNNNGEARLDLLRQFQGRARQLIWLNPEDRNRWGSGDSEMLRYASACTETFSCRTLNDLERIIDRLLRSA